MSIRTGRVCTRTWAGTFEWLVDVIAETPKRYRVRTRKKTCLPNRGWVPKGTVVLVPKDAVTLLPEAKR